MTPGKKEAVSFKPGRSGWEPLIGRLSLSFSSGKAVTSFVNGVNSGRSRDQRHGQSICEATRMNP